MSFGERLQEVRRSSGMTQEDFAGQLKVSRQAVSKWESSRGYPEIEKIIYICNRYGVTMNELFSEEIPLGRQAGAAPQPGGGGEPYPEGRAGGVLQQPVPRQQADRDWEPCRRRAAGSALREIHERRYG